MISESLQDELRYKYNPEGSMLRKHQLKMLEILDYIDEICKKNDIHYWLSSGTCLGAVRHKGFIPWDDDLDIEMMREDYIKFIRFFKENEKYAIQTYKTDKYYYTPFAKVREKDSVIYNSLYKFKGVFVDILCLEYSSKFGALLLYYAHIILLSRLYNRLKNTRNMFVFSALSFLFQLNKRFFFTIVPIARFFTKMSRKKELRHTFGTGWIDNVRVESEIFPLKKIPFEQKEFPVPGNYDSYLKRIYGDYMSIPTADKLPQSHAKFLN